jgi:hypothetical protein
MFVLPQPRVKSVWIDHALDITMIVHGRVLSGPTKGDMLVTCRHGEREWPDAIPLECFATELIEVG